MTIRVTFTDDPARVLHEAHDFLAAEPVRNNVLFTLLHQRIARPEPGRYWIASDSDSVCGVVFQSPLTYPALVTAMPPETVQAVVGKIIGDGIKLPGAGSNATTAAMFAGQWAERTKCPARVKMAGRQYECKAVIPPARAAKGHMRRAAVHERPSIIEWSADFNREAGDLPMDIEAAVDLVYAEERIWVWDDGGPVSMAISSTVAENVARIQAVYTPPGQRGRGYASACVAALTGQVLAAGHRCCLFTDLANPVSNSIYQRIGYEAVQEVLRYQFE